MINLTIPSRWDERWVELAQDAQAHEARCARQDELLLKMRQALDVEVELTWADLGRALGRASELWRLSPGGLPRALALKEEAAQVWVRLDRQAALSVVLGQQALVLMGLGRHEQAREVFMKAREVAAQAQALERYEHSFTELEALLYAARGELERALACLDGLLEVVEHALLRERTARLRDQVYAAMSR